MSAITVAEKKALMLKVLDSRVTRGELLDLITDRVKGELASKEAEVEKRIEALEETNPSVESVIPLLQKHGAVKNFSLDGPWEKDRDHVEIKVTAEVPLKFVPKELLKPLRELEALQKERRALHSAYQELTKNKRHTRLQMIREALDSTPEGKAILDAVGSLTGILAKQMEGSDE